MRQFTLRVLSELNAIFPFRDPTIYMSDPLIQWLKSFYEDQMLPLRLNLNDPRKYTKDSLFKRPIIWQFYQMSQLLLYL